MVTSYPTRTSPVLRGKWVLENILGAPAPASPMFLRCDGASSSAKTLREQLKSFRANCLSAAICSRARPLGLLVEQWAPLELRDKEGTIEGFGSLLLKTRTVLNGLAG